MKELALRYKDNDTIYLFDDLFEVVEFDLYGVEEVQTEGTAIIHFNKTTIEVPTSTFIYQADDEYFDAIPVTKHFDDLPLMTTDGMLGINRIHKYSIEIDETPVGWNIPLIPRGYSAILKHGLIIVVNPIRKKLATKAIRRKK